LYEYHADRADLLIRSTDRTHSRTVLDLLFPRGFIDIKRLGSLSEKSGKVEMDNDAFASLDEIFSDDPGSAGVCPPQQLSVTAPQPTSDNMGLDMVRERQLSQEEFDELANMWEVYIPMDVVVVVVVVVVAVVVVVVAVVVVVVLPFIRENSTSCLEDYGCSTDECN